MEILVKRIARKPEYTIGKLYINGQYFCDTLEDTDRGLMQDMPLSEIKKLKVHGKTAIPSGVYSVSMNTISPKYSKVQFYKTLCNGMVPRLLNVRGYEGVLIHVGNTAKDTDGCLLVGKNKVVGQVIDSKSVYTQLYKKMQLAYKNGENIKIQIK